MHDREYHVEFARAAALRRHTSGTLAGAYWYGYCRGLLAWHNLAMGWALPPEQTRPLSWAGMEGEPVSRRRSDHDVAFIAGLADGRLWDRPLRRPGLVRLAHRLSGTNGPGWAGIADTWSIVMVRRWVIGGEELPQAVRDQLEAALLGDVHGG